MKKSITIIGDSLAMVDPENSIYYQDTYPSLLQNLVNYQVIERNRRRNCLIYLKETWRDDILYNNSDVIVIHIGIVDCSPRLTSLFVDRVLSIMVKVPIIGLFVKLFFKFQTRYRWFFTKYFPKTYISKKDFKVEYYSLIHELWAKSGANKIILVNISDTSNENKRKSYNIEKNIIEYNKIISCVQEAFNNSEDFRCELIDMYSATKKNKKLILDEGIHLSKVGHKYLADKLYSIIK